MADLELRQAFAELQRKTLETRTQVKVADAQIAQLEREKTKLKLTASEVSSLPEETRLFQSCGRMFVLGSREEVEVTLKKNFDRSQKKIKDLEAKKVYLEKSVKESEGSLRELVSQRRK